MNIHPLFVHFPIGLLVTYAFLEMMRLRVLTSQPYYKPLKVFLLIAGTAMAYLTAMTGDWAEQMVTETNPDLRDLVERHALFAGTTITIFSLLAGAYILDWATHYSRLRPVVTHRCVRATVRIVFVSAPVLALLGLAAITITGGLGASIVYGPEVDPIVSMIYSLFAPR